MTQLALVFEKTPYHIRFNFHLENVKLSGFSYSCDYDEILDHIKIIKTNFEQFTNEFTAGSTGIHKQWDNNDSADVTLYCSNGVIGMRCESKESSSCSFSIGIVNKPGIIANLKEIIGKLNEQIKASKN